MAGKPPPFQQKPIQTESGRSRDLVEKKESAAPGKSEPEAAKKVGHYNHLDYNKNPVKKQATKIGDCKHPDCRYRNKEEGRLGYAFKCNYLSITGRSRIAQLPEELRDPAKCPLYDPGPKEHRREKIIIEHKQTSTSTAANRVKPIQDHKPNPAPLKPWQEEALKLHSQGLNNGEIVAALGVKQTTLAQFLTRRGLKRNKTIRVFIDWEQGKRLWESGATDKEVAEALGCGISTANHFRKKHGIAATGHKQESAFDWALAKKLWNEGALDKEIAEALGCSKTSVERWRKKNGLISKYWWGVKETK